MPSLNILTVNWTWYLAGGDWTYIDNVCRVYRDHGHKVIPFSMKSPKNIDADGFEEFFIEHVDYKELNKDKSISNGLKAVTKSVYSLEAKRKLELLLKKQKIDIAHLHNIHHYITPSILPLLKKHGIPVIWTLHDYTLICPENSFISNNKICENCIGGTFYHCAIQRCKKKSFLASSLAAVENYTHRYLNLFKYVDYFLCPSKFLFDKFRQFDFYADKMVLLHNCFDFKTPLKNGRREGYIAFVGRLHETKGVLTLLKAIEGLKTSTPVVIVGDGPERKEIEDYISSNAISDIILTGFKTNEEVIALMANAKMVVCPSEWYENFPSVVIEAMSVKTPVIGTAIGGIPELIIHEETGLLCKPFDYVDLRRNIERLLSDDLLGEKLAERAYTRTFSMVNHEQHYRIIKEVYAKLGLQL